MFCCRDQEKFVLLCLQLLNTHLSLALTGGMAQAVLGQQATPLRELLFRWDSASPPPHLPFLPLLHHTSACTCCLYLPHVSSFHLPFFFLPHLYIYPFIHLLFVPFCLQSLFSYIPLFVFLSSCYFPAFNHLLFITLLLSPILFSLLLYSSLCLSSLSSLSPFLSSVFFFSFLSLPSVFSFFTVVFFPSFFSFSSSTFLPLLLLIFHPSSLHLFSFFVSFSTMLLFPSLILSSSLYLPFTSSSYFVFHYFLFLFHVLILPSHFLSSFPPSLYVFNYSLPPFPFFLFHSLSTLFPLHPFFLFFFFSHFYSSSIILPFYLLPRLVDAKLPRAIEAGVCEALSSPLLLPPLASRMRLLYGLLPKSPEDWGQLSYGQVRSTLRDRGRRRMLKVEEVRERGKEEEDGGRGRLIVKDRWRWR